MIGKKEFSVSEQGEILTAFAKALESELHVLDNRPDLLWQQLYNSLSPLNHSEINSLLKHGVDQRKNKKWLKRHGGKGASGMRVIASLSSGVESCDWSPVLDLLAVGCRDGSVQLLSKNKGDPVVLGKHSGPVSCCQFTSDGLFLISGSNDSTLFVFSMVTQKQTGVFKEHQSQVTCLATMPDGRHVVSGGMDRKLIVWDVEHLTPLRTLDGHDRGVLCCHLSRDGQCLVSGDTGGKIGLWDMKSYQLKRSFIAHDDAILCCAFDRNGDRLITGAADGTACVWKINDLQNPIHLDGHSDEVSDCDDVDQDRVMTVSADQSIRCWDKSSGAPVSISQKPTGPITCLAVEPDGQIMYTGSTNGSVIAWTIADLGKEENASGHGAAVTSAVISQFDKIASSSLDGSAIIWDIVDGGVVHRFECQEKLNGCAFHRRGATLITTSSHQPLIEWDCITGDKLRTIPKGLDTTITCCASDPGKGILILGTMNGMKVIEPDDSHWQIDLKMKSGIQTMQEEYDQVRHSVGKMGYLTTQESQQLSKEISSLISPMVNLASTNCIAVQAGRSLAAVGDRIGRVTLVNLTTKSIVKEFLLPNSGSTTPTNSIAMAPDGKHFAAGYGDGNVIVYSLEDDGIIQWQDSGIVLSCAFSADSQLLAVGKESKHLTVWFWKKRTEVYHLPMTHAVQACAFSHQQPVLVCADAGGDVSIVEMLGLDSVLFTPKDWRKNENVSV